MVSLALEEEIPTPPQATGLRGVSVANLSSAATLSPIKRKAKQADGTTPERAKGNLLKFIRHKVLNYCQYQGLTLSLWSTARIT